MDVWAEIVHRNGAWLNVLKVYAPVAGVNRPLPDRAHCQQCTDKRRRWRAANRDRVVGKLRQWQRNHKTNVWRYWLRQRYGISPNDYDQMLKQQGGVCAICDQPESRRHRGKLTSLAVDHDHHTGRVRGLLCSKCNMKLGALVDDPGWLQRAIEYAGVTL